MSRQHDLPTVLAIGLVAYLSATLLHELGHGVSCAAFGGGFEGVSTSWCACDKTPMSPWAIRFEKAAGTGVNLLIGTGAALLLHRTHASPSTRYALWFGAATHLFLGAGYLVFDPLFGFGDWTAFLEGLQQAGFWRVGLIGAGLVVAASALGFLVPYLGVPERRQNGRQLALLPWCVIGCGWMTAVAALNVGGPQFAFTSFLATGAGTSMLAWMHHLRAEDGVDEPLTVPRSNGWRLAGGCALVLTVVFGRGLVF